MTAESTPDDDGTGAPPGRRWLVVVLALFVVLAVAVTVVARSDGDDVAGPPAGSVPAGSVPAGSAPGATGPGDAPGTVSTAPPGPVPVPPVPTTVPATPAPGPTSSLTSGAVEPAAVVRRGNETRREVALSFDAGSDTGFAGEILDILRAEEVPSTFGMTGRWAEANPALVARMAAEGHQLVNHSYDHPSFTGRSTGAAPLSRVQRQDQLRRADDAVRRAAAVTTSPWFRPPYGDEDVSVRTDVALAGYRYELMWTVDSLGWRGVDAGEVVQRCLDAAVPGAIYLFHVGAESTDHAALRAIVAGLRGRGYGFVTATGVLRP